MFSDMKNENSYLGKLLEHILGFKWKDSWAILCRGNLSNKG